MEPRITMWPDIQDPEQRKQLLADSTQAAPDLAAELPWRLAIDNATGNVALAVRTPRHHYGLFETLTDARLLAEQSVVRSRYAHLSGQAEQEDAHRAAHDVRYLPVPEALAIIRDPKSPDAEVGRRLVEGAANRKRRAEEAKQQAEEQERQRTERAAADAERQRINREFKLDEWNRLPPTSRLLHAVAVALEESNPGAAGALHVLANDNRHNETGHLPFPARRWWGGVS